MKSSSNRGDSNRIQHLKWIKRLRSRGIPPDSREAKGYRTTGTPCSCTMCDPHKAWKAKDKISTRRRLDSQADSD